LKVRRLIISLGLFVAFTTGFVNIGIIAMDDYEDIISNVIPAGKRSVSQLIAAADYRSAIPTVCLSLVAKLAKYLGVQSPANQLRVVLGFLGIFSLGLQLFFATRLFRLVYADYDRRELIALFLLSFYFVCPLFFTRPMIESLGGPFLFASVYYACAFYKQNKIPALVLGILFLTLASLFRFQAGVCFFSLGAVALLPRSHRLRNASVFTLVCVGAFLLTGGLDYWMKGEFHGSFLAYWRFNAANSSSFGVQPFYNFLLLFVGLSFPPLFFTRYKNLDWKREYGFLIPCLIYFGVFVTAHSFVPHKEERFMIPVIGLFLMLLVPLANDLWERGRRVRVGFFLVLNSFLLFFASYSVAQNNVVGLGQFLENHPRIRSVVSFKESLVLLPEAFVSRAVDWKLNGDLPAVSAMSCDEVLAVRKDLAPAFKTVSDKFIKISEFKPGLLEALLVELNPYRNGRRSAIALYSPLKCGSGE
jgi:hypothetical protein